MKEENTFRKKKGITETVQIKGQHGYGEIQRESHRDGEKLFQAEKH